MAESEKRFEELLRELEVIVASLERDELDLEKSIELYQRGVDLSRECHRRLDEAERKVHILREGTEPTEYSGAPK